MSAEAWKIQELKQKRVNILVRANQINKTLFRRLRIDFKELLKELKK